MRMKAIIQRTPSRDDGTLGNVSVVGNPFTCYTMELSDRGNANDISCIPFGFYVCKWTNHPLHGWCWQVMGVKDRQDILLHSLNLAGNVEQGYAKQALGCVGLGMGVGIFKAGTKMHVEGPHGLEVEALTRDQRGITDSKAALAALCQVMGTGDFDLEIRAPAVGA